MIFLKRETWLIVVIYDCSGDDETKETPLHCGRFGNCKQVRSPFFQALALSETHADVGFCDRGSKFLKEWMQHLEEHADLRYPDIF